MSAAPRDGRGTAPGSGPDAVGTPALPESTSWNLLDAEGAGRLLNVPASWVLAQAREDRIPHLRLGRYVRFNADDLIAWSQTRARGPRPRRTGTHPVSNGGSPA